MVALEVDDDGTLAKIIKSAASGPIQIGSLIAMLAEEDEDWKEINAKGAVDESGSSTPDAATEETSKVSAGVFSNTIDFFQLQPNFCCEKSNSGQSENEWRSALPKKIQKNFINIFRNFYFFLNIFRRFTFLFIF